MAFACFVMVWSGKVEVCDPKHQSPTLNPYPL